MTETRGVHMSTPGIADSYGPYQNSEPFRLLNSLSQRAFARYHELTDKIDRSKETAHSHSITRMMYLTESTSFAVRLTGSWAASLPALSLMRDRFEQVVRFSYLAHQPDDGEWRKYLFNAIYQQNRFGRKVAEWARTRNAFDSVIGAFAEWETENLTREQKDKLAQWDSLDLETLAKRRDSLVNDKEQLPTFIRRPLAVFYVSIYAQASSIVHYDFRALKLLGFFVNREGTTVLAPDPNWPIMLNLHCALFDIIQCAECLALKFELHDFDHFKMLHDEWESYSDSFFADDEQTKGSMPQTKGHIR